MADPIKVLQVFDSLEISGGVQSVVMNTYRKIDKSLVQFDFAVYDAPESNSYQPEIERMGGNVIPVKGLAEAGLNGFYQQFISLFRRRRYDAVHAHNIHHNGLILKAAKKAGVPIRISHSHQSFDERNESFARKALANYLKHLNNKSATRRVACSDLAGKFLYGRNRQFEVLPNAVNIDAYDNLDDKQKIRRKFGYSENKKILIHIGRFCVPKNQTFLIEIIKQLNDDNTVLLIAGDGELKEEILDMIDSQPLTDRITYLGLRDDVPELLKMSDIMLLPSIHEGLPVVAIEAQAAGCMSLLSDKITKQADLGVGLVKYLGIDDAQIWANEIRSYSRTKETDITEIHKKMKKLKFDSDTNLKAWYELYGVQV